MRLCPPFVHRSHYFVMVVAVPHVMSEFLVLAETLPFSLLQKYVKGPHRLTYLCVFLCLCKDIGESV